ncbi:MAG: hypothetical protein QXF49_02990 [Thermosphaera sp.]
MVLSEFFVSITNAIFKVEDMISDFHLKFLSEVLKPLIRHGKRARGRFEAFEDFGFGCSLEGKPGRNYSSNLGKSYASPKGFRTLE